MLQWAHLVTRWRPEEVEAFLADVLSRELHPMAAKKRLAHEIVEQFHGPVAAARAEHAFEQTIQRHQEPTSIPEVALALPLPLVEVLVSIGAAPSKSEARRLITNGGVSIDNRKVTSVDFVLDGGGVIKVGPRRFFRVVPA